MQGTTHIEYKQTKRGKWRAYEVEQRAHMHWVGPNFKFTVLHLQRWYWVSYESKSLTEALDRVAAAKAEGHATVAQRDADCEAVYGLHHP
ncbi:MAG TPA: hypothetical protein VNM48_07850 [Chloroflexota bacterium]|nr:hypothetical protein [Chloroflexota bacterium]